MTNLPTPAEPEDAEIEVVEVTPELAEKWLAKNTHNRNLRHRNVQRFAEDMRNGDWAFTGEAIKFAYDGLLLDGQTRLHAVVEAGVTVRFLVVRNLAHASQEDMDSGAARQFHDALKLRGEVNTPSLAALVRRVAEWDAETKRLASVRKATGKADERHRLGSAGFSNAQLFRVLDAHPEVREIVPIASRLAYHCGLPASLIGLAWWVFSRIDSPKNPVGEDDVSFFFERLADGQNLARGNPIYELSRAIDGGFASGRSRMTPTYLMAITIKAWNAYRLGEDIGSLRWRVGGAHPERFPEPI